VFATWPVAQRWQRVEPVEALQNGKGRAQQLKVTRVMSRESVGMHLVSVGVDLGRSWFVHGCCVKNTHALYLQDCKLRTQHACRCKRKAAHHAL
jgi:hypothetical protein